MIEKILIVISVISISIGWSLYKITKVQRKQALVEDLKQEVIKNNCNVGSTYEK